jgi:hypothetical protein
VRTSARRCRGRIRRYGRELGGATFLETPNVRYARRRAGLSAGLPRCLSRTQLYLLVGCLSSPQLVRHFKMNRGPITPLVAIAGGETVALITPNVTQLQANASRAAQLPLASPATTPPGVQPRLRTSC